MASKTAVVRGAAALGAAAAATTDIAACDAAWVVLPSEVDEAAAIISPSASANALMTLGTELAKDARVQEALSERMNLGGPASLLALPSDQGADAVLKRLRAELDLLREELGEQHDLNSELLAQNDVLRRENAALKDDAPLPVELSGLSFPAEAFAGDTLKDAAASMKPDELDYKAPTSDDEEEGAEPAPEDGKPLLEAALGVAAVILLFVVLRKMSPDKAQRAGKVCASVLAGAWAFLKNTSRHR